jgi:hypothetical protein
MIKKDFLGANRIKCPILAIVLTLLLASPAALPAADKAYLVTELRPAGNGTELVLRDLESGSEGKLLQLVVYDRDRLLDLAADEEIPATRAGQGAKGSDAVNNMIKHNVLLNIQQQTFNSYMWSSGFNYQPASGKMW